MSFFMILNKKLTEHQFEYLTPISGRRVEPTLSPTSRKLVRADESIDTWVSEVMTKDIFTLSPNDSVAKAIKLIKSKNIHHIPLLEDNILVGMLSDRDIMWSEHFADGDNILLKDLMSKIIVICNEDTALDQLAKVFYSEQINGMPVINDQSQLVGMITHRDLLRWIYEID